MSSNIVTARFTYGNSTKTRGLHQWDYGQVLKFEGLSLPSAYTVHFANQLLAGNAKTQVGGADGVSIPDEYLTTGLPVYAWVFLHTGESDGETVYSVMIPVTARPRPVEDAPTPVQQGVIDTAIAALNAGVAAAEDAQEAIENMGVTAETLDAGSSAAVTKSVNPETGAVTLAFGIPKGEQGERGPEGPQGIIGMRGLQGFTFKPAVSEEGVISWTVNGPIAVPDSVNIKGPAGQSGDDGYSPTVAVTDITGGHRVTITDADGVHVFDVLDGAPGSGATIHICSSSEYDSTTRVPTVTDPDENTFYLVPAADGASLDMFDEWIYTNNAWEMFGSASVDLSGYQTKITASGLLKGNGNGGVTAATAGTDYGTYSKPIGGIPSTDMTEAVQTSLGKADTALQNAPITDVQVNSTSVLEGTVAKVPVGGDNTFGVFKSASISEAKTGGSAQRVITPKNQHQSVFWGLAKAANDSTQAESSNGVGNYTDSAKSSIQSMLDTPSQAAIAPNKETATATAAHAIGTLFLMGGKLYRATVAIAIGDAIVTSGAGANAEQTSVVEEIPTVPVTDVQVNGSSILNNGVANVPMANANNYGVVKLGSGLRVQDNTKVAVTFASNSSCKEGTNNGQCITPSVQNASTFYGLAKAAGDSTQSSSSNAVGTYTDTAKVAIQNMLGVYREWELIAEATVGEDSAQVDVATDLLGQPFELRKMYARVWLEPSTTGSNDYILASSLITNTDNVSSSTSLPTRRYQTNGAKTYMEYIGELIVDVHIGTGKSSNGEGSTGSVDQISSVKALSIKAITGLRLKQYSGTSTLIPKDTVIKIYGIRI